VQELLEQHPSAQMGVWCCCDLSQQLSLAKAVKPWLLLIFLVLLSLPCSGVHVCLLLDLGEGVSLEAIFAK
jgi:hypothetical protein